ncbi:MAG: hypothetical protein ACREQA_06150, partial [Candidatus Binatia bacterium]
PIFRHLPISRQTSLVTIPTNPKPGQPVTFLILASYRCFLDLDGVWHKPCQDYLQKKEEKGMNLMKIDASFLAALLLTGTTLMAQVAVQGVEQALLSTAVEWSMNAIRAGTKLLPNTISSGWST